MIHFKARNYSPLGDPIGITLIFINPVSPMIAVLKMHFLDRKNFDQRLTFLASFHKTILTGLDQNCLIL